LLPLVGADDPHLSQQLVLAHLHAAIASGPVSQESLRSEGRRAQDVERHADTFEGSQHLLDAATWDALLPADGL
jgi:hypothetical protein